MRFGLQGHIGHMGTIKLFCTNIDMSEDAEIQQQPIWPPTESAYHTQVPHKVTPEG